jgi:hypothetical protein
LRRKAELPESDWNDFLSRKASHDLAVKRRRRFITAAISVPAAAAVLLLLFLMPFKTFVPDKKLFLLICLPVCLLIMLAASYLIYAKAKDTESFFGGRFLIYELFISAGGAASLFTVSEDPGIKQMLIIFAVITVSDILLTSLFAVIRRRQIFVARSKYLDGLLFMMTLVALFVMIAESALYGIIPL